MADWIGYLPEHDDDNGHQLLRGDRHRRLTFTWHKSSTKCSTTSDRTYLIDCTQFHHDTGAVNEGRITGWACRRSQFELKIVERDIEMARKNRRACTVRFQVI